jgi:ABC-type multidrug transport system fused ATPase/permease subunit
MGVVRLFFVMNQADLSGKSTLIKLLTRLFDPTEGDILINDVNIKEYNSAELYEKMSVLFQDYRFSFHGI